LTETLGFLLTVAMGFLFTMTLGFQLTISTRPYCAVEGVAVLFPGSLAASPCWVAFVLGSLLFFCPEGGFSI
jgi:hypothetical protein